MHMLPRVAMAMPSLRSTEMGNILAHAATSRDGHAQTHDSRAYIALGVLRHIIRVLACRLANLLMTCSFL